MGISASSLHCQQGLQLPGGLHRDALGTELQSSPRADSGEQVLPRC